MYEWLKKNRLLQEPHLTWGHLRDQDSGYREPPLHQAIQREDMGGVKACLTRGDDIDESDALGRTALHVAIQKGAYDVFQLLLSQGADCELSDGKRHTPLHAAAISDIQGQFLQDLIDRGSPVNMQVYFGGTPLDCAIEAKNLKAIEILIKANADISEKNRNALDAPAFSSLHERGIIAPSAKDGGFASLCRWIARGDCVVLHYNGLNGIMYHDPKPLNHSPRLVYVDVNSQTNLLAEDEWPDFLKNAGYSYVPYDEAKIKQGQFSNVAQFRFGYS